MVLVKINEAESGSIRSAVTALEAVRVKQPELRAPRASRQPLVGRHLSCVTVERLPFRCPPPVPYEHPRHQPVQHKATSARTTSACPLRARSLGAISDSHEPPRTPGRQSRAGLHAQGQLRTPSAQLPKLTVDDVLLLGQDSGQDV